jgi:sterol desaturase/sphingolipid hydroxylase (fatty acid hydroxylase superfamily)
VTWANSAISMAATLAAQIALIVFGFGIERLRPARHRIPLLWAMHSLHHSD